MHTEISRSHNTIRGKVCNGISQQGDGLTTNSKRIAHVSFFYALIFFIAVSGG